MKSFLGLLAIMLPALIAMVIQDEQVHTVLIANAILITTSMYILNKYKLIKTHATPTLLFITFISIFALISSCDSVMTGSEAYPYIPGGDGEMYYQQAKILAKGNPLEAPNLIKLNYLGYQIVLGTWFKIFGISLFKGLVLNYAILIFSIILLSISTYIITKNKKVSLYTLILSFCCSHFIGSGIMLLKDVFIIYAFSLALLVLVKFHSGSHSPILLLYLLLSGALLGFLRLPFLVVLPILFLLFGNWAKPVTLITFILIVAGSISFIPYMMSFSKFKFDQKVVTSIVFETTFVEEELSSIKNEGSTVQALIGGYTSKPLYQRILLLPIPILIQFVTPFKFWSTDFISDHIYYIVDQLNIFWFGFIGVFMFIVLLKLKWIKDTNIKKLFLFGFVMYLLMAFIYGGAVPRYATPFILFMMPAMGYLIYLIRNDAKLKNHTYKFFVMYYGVAFGLFVTYFGLKLF